ncbi:hypothetical protein IAR50_001869 [Cryptococcus sp. DSM 104548]
MYSDSQQRGTSSRRSFPGPDDGDPGAKKDDPPFMTGGADGGPYGAYQQQQNYAALGFPYTPASSGMNLSSAYNAAKSSPSTSSARRSSAPKANATPPQPPQANPVTNPSPSARYYNTGPEPHLHSSPYSNSAPPQVITHAHPFSVPGQPPSAHPSYQAYPYDSQPQSQPQQGWIQYPGFHQTRHAPGSGPSPTIHQSPLMGDRPAPAEYEYVALGYQQWAGAESKPALPMGHWQNTQRLSQSDAAQPPPPPSATSHSPNASAQNASPMIQQGPWATYPSLPGPVPGQGQGQGQGVPPHAMGRNGMTVQPYWMHQPQQQGWQGYYPSGPSPAPAGEGAAILPGPPPPRAPSAPIPAPLAAPPTPRTAKNMASKDKSQSKKKEASVPAPIEIPKRLSENDLEDVQDTKWSGSHTKKKRKRKKKGEAEGGEEDEEDRAERPEKPKSKLNPPKQAPSAWQLFFADELARAKALEPLPDTTSPGGTVHPHKFNIAQIAKDAGQNYANLSPERKAHYAERVRAAREQHAKDMLAWQATLTPEDVREENLFRAQQRKEGKSRKGNIKDPNAPKKPLSAYFLFLKAIRDNQEIRDQVWGEAVATTRQSILAAEKWRSLTDVEKKPYLEQAEYDKQAYEVARKQYEADSAARARGEDIPVRTPVDVSSSPPKPPSSIFQPRPPLPNITTQVPLQISSSSSPKASASAPASEPLSDPVMPVAPLTTPVMASSANPTLSAAPVGISPQEVKPPMAFTDFTPPSPPAGDFKSSIGDVFNFIAE